MSRIESGRRRAELAKRAIALSTGAGFVVAFLMARATHPGQASTPARDGASETSSGELSSDESFELDDGGSLQPALGAAPQVQTHVS